MVASFMGAYCRRKFRIPDADRDVIGLRRSSGDQNNRHQPAREQTPHHAHRDRRWMIAIAPSRVDASVSGISSSRARDNAPSRSSFASAR